ncbi:unnamed protein product [Adineta steineri]|uniref:RRM domain-containing protein n=3 Tax=Adineta steineri TaxID=433720 RepID=A0A814MQZ0_9BILA|nr:unnamed protein product [Adineta steineri]CAF3794448.1 unnamed protein product [Adineta steineri]
MSSSSSPPHHQSILPTIPKSDLDACQLEQEHVHKVYNNIAHNFSDTRHKPWPRVVEFLRSFPSHSFILDVGCGNGKYMNTRNDLMMIGCDRSEGLLSICRDRQYQVFLSDCMNIPVPTNMFDGVICIAVLHHISTENRRLMALKEIVRLLKPGGQALITVWAKEQEVENKKSTYITNKNTKTCPIHTKNEQTNEIIIHTPRTEFQQPDCLVPWTKPTEKHLRYYHVFVKDELEHILSHISQGNEVEQDKKLLQSTTLYVGNLSFFTTEEQIHELFSRAGDVKRIIMGLDKTTKTPCGFCFVEYYTRNDAEQAMRYINQTRLDDRIIRTDWDAGFIDGRQFGRGRSGGQVRDEYRKDYDPGRGGFGKRFNPALEMEKGGLVV